MYWKSASAYAIALLGLAPTSFAANSVVYQDAQSGFTFSSYDAEYVIGSSIAYRIAIPSDATPNASYDAVIQVVAPTAVGWAGLAWAGSMVRSPLTIGWASGSTPVVSSRWATAHSMPSSYTGATYTLLSKATTVNATHWKYTALCSGCTSFVGSAGNKILTPDGDNRFAFAYSSSKPSGTSPDATITVHTVTNYWTHDFNAAKNDNFDALVKQNA